MCMARVWGDCGRGAQCSRVRMPDSEFCKLVDHRGPGLPMFGRVDGPVPPQKLGEMLEAEGKGFPAPKKGQLWYMRHWMWLEVRGRTRI